MTVLKPRTVGMVDRVMDTPAMVPRRTANKRGYATNSMEAARAILKYQLFPTFRELVRSKSKLGGQVVSWMVDNGAVPGVVAYRHVTLSSY